jgi:hypothetical protein
LQFQCIWCTSYSSIGSRLLILINAPSFAAQVVFAVVYYEIMAMKDRLESGMMPPWLTAAMKEEPAKDQGGLVKGAASPSGEPGDFGGSSMGDELLGGKTGDELLSELDETQPALYGNSIVRVGRWVSI